jgi:bacteriocin-like protein
MSDERIPQNQPQDELSDEQLEQVTGGDGNRQQPDFRPNPTGDGKPQLTDKTDVEVSSYSFGATQTGSF